VSRSIHSVFLTPACWSCAAFSWGNTRNTLYERAALTHNTETHQYRLHYQNNTEVGNIPRPKKLWFTATRIIYGSRGIWTGTATGLRVWRSGLQIPVLARHRVHYSSITRPDRPWGPPSVLYNRYRGSFPVVKRPGREVDHSPPFIAKVKNKRL
jgi:hypothetical protein